MGTTQPDLFAATPALPTGMRYATEIVSEAEERMLLEEIAKLQFRPFEFQQYLATRQVAYFGWRYDYGAHALTSAPPIPDFLLPLRDRAASFADMTADELRQAMVTEYPAGAGIGWHRDRAVFGEVIGVSLLAPCKLRFRLPTDAGWERITVMPEPRSIYLLQGAARTDWYHSIPAVPALRYSVTFRRYAPASSARA
jgi:alkylated DNA repair dioxygenase AlkB